MLVSSLALASEDVAVRFCPPYLNCYANPFTFKAMASYFTMGPNSLIFTYFQYSQGKLCIKGFIFQKALKSSKNHFHRSKQQNKNVKCIFKKDLASNCHGSYRNPFTKSKKVELCFLFTFFFLSLSFLFTFFVKFYTILNGTLPQ